MDEDPWPGGEPTPGSSGNGGHLRPFLPPEKVSGGPVMDVMDNCLFFQGNSWTRMDAHGRNMDAHGRNAMDDGKKSHD